MIPLTKKEEKMHKKQKFSVLMIGKKYFKVKDHCHYTGKYRCSS